MDVKICVLCKKSLTNGQPTVVIREKGSTSINKAAEIREDDIQVRSGQSVHQQCRREYCNKNVISRDLKAKPEAADISSCTLRSQKPVFNYREHCLFCAQPVEPTGKKRGYDDTVIFPVRTRDFQTTIERICKERSDSWSEKVHSRIEFAPDLHAADAVYHQVCSINFRTGKQIPLLHQTMSDTSTQQPAGRPVRSHREEAFLKVADYLIENDDEQITVSDLANKMEKFCKDPYSVKYMKVKLEEHFGNQIIITSINGKANVVTLRSTASAILNKFYETPKLTDSEAEKLRMVEAVAEMIKSDIKSLDTSKTFYPTPDEIASIEKNSALVPESLKLLLIKLFSEKKAEVKMVSVGQAIVQATRPRVLLAPLQIGLAVQMHHHFASKFLIDSLNKHGFCSSYSEVKKFEMCAAASQSTDTPGIPNNHFVQYVADNVDHNVQTLDGLNTFHGMGIIAAVTPGVQRRDLIPRCITTREAVVAKAKIHIHYYKSADNPLKLLVYEKRQNIEYVDQTHKLDLLWKLAWPLRSPRAGWSGMMQAVTHGDYPGKSSITFLPMIDMSSSDMSCVYSTLIFVCEQASRHHVSPVITFDQPLWWKAQLIVANEPSASVLHSVVLRLGGFHAEMSFLGCIGQIMSGSGLQELLEVVYAPNTVGHMLSGKAISRAVRGHLLVDSALNAMLVAKAFGISLPEENVVSDREQTVKAIATNEDEDAQSRESLETGKSDDDDSDGDGDDDDDDLQTEFTAMNTQQTETMEFSTCSDEPDNLADTSEAAPINEDLNEALKIYDKLLQGEILVEEVCGYSNLDNVHKRLEEEKEAMKNQRTACLWINYMEMIGILRRFIKAERTGNWKLHLKSLQEMLPYLAAAGHSLYAKSVFIYLQQMLKLPLQHPDVSEAFESGYHVIRRSDRYWAGLSSDLVIEQVLMRTMKTSGGLTRGRGMSESQRAQWLLSMPACSNVNGAMQEVSGTNYVTSDQHKDISQSRLARDDKDVRSLLGYLQRRNPFCSEDFSLRNIATGVTADGAVNADQAEMVGLKILKSMEGFHAGEYTFKKAAQVVTMDCKVRAKAGGDVLSADPQLLFQRLLTAAHANESTADIFKYELCSNPSSLFEPSGMPRQANKPVLADAMWTAVGKGSDMPGPTDGEAPMQYVIDGGSLLHRVPWPRDATFNSVCEIYVDYVCRNYKHATIVFDGYAAGPSTKDVMHLRRSGGVVGAKVSFDGGMPIRTKKEHFLANNANKQRFVLMLSEKLEEAGCKTVHATGDADVLIVQTAVHYAAQKVTTVIGEDTDLLVLLCHHADVTSYPLFFQSGRKQASKQQRVWHIPWTMEALGADTCRLLPFVHAVAGCDTTSRLFGIGKGVPLKKLKDPTFQKQADIFCNSGATKKEIWRAGEAVLVALYGGREDEKLDALRYRRFSEKVSISTSPVQVQTLPPTSAAAQYHSARVYLQVQNWMGNQQLNPEDWGWCNIQGRLQPNTTDLPAAPGSLLKVVRCNCKTDCNTRRCTCKKLGLDCSPACGECRGVGCTNSDPILIDDGNQELGNQDGLV